MNEVACPVMTPETGHCSTPVCDEGTSTRRRRQDPAPDCDCCALGSMKGQNPHFMPFVGHRGTLARTLYQKSMVDQGLRTMDKRLVSMCQRNDSYLFNFVWGTCREIEACEVNVSKDKEQLLCNLLFTITRQCQTPCILLFVQCIQ